jgi:hypothetical protein
MRCDMAYTASVGNPGRDSVDGVGRCRAWSFHSFYLRRMSEEECWLAVATIEHCIGQGWVYSCPLIGVVRRLVP